MKRERLADLKRLILKDAKGSHYAVARAILAERPTERQIVALFACAEWDAMMRAPLQFLIELRGLATFSGIDEMRFEDESKAKRGKRVLPKSADRR